MKIAQVAPLHESVPPRTYGGTERVVSYLTEALVDAGHEVTLYASGDSRTRARLVPVVAEGLRLAPERRDPLASHVLLMDRVLRDADRYDIVHFHTDYLHFPLVRALSLPHVTTLHGRLDLPELGPLYQAYHDLPVISISDDQRRPLPQAGWLATVYNGLPADLYRFGSGDGGYLAFLGRISPEKGIERALAIAKAAGLPLKVAAKVDAVDREYYETVVAPQMDHPLIEFIGEIGESDKGAFLGAARALLFPIDWPEPFGLVMTEAMACGTPVIAWRRGSVPEVIEEGRSGFIVDSVDQAVTALGRLDDIDRRDCRRAFEERFTAARMAQDYVATYRTALAQHRQPRLAV
ncbi:glycosyltransferase family 4 protein [Thiohalobacter sp. IOR34]|uniref:glycosyltransferase family 4 protein n=1 Tax=Thiohalobacter sp. IOR34 TaxID=3057176 RepID=UPI0025B0AACA|nr:glycosyltransferase family 4 protein [Thiohalobacter sp. IOR34]WJW75896.1 glycosyltransferase family 4 protein [Thiohalobacter sp. IOR34]